jgi:two-component system copper resistance phosphate regulon response regulator CusR
MANLPRLLLVEDDVKTACALASAFEREGFAVSLAHDGDLGAELLAKEPWDVVVLDWMLSGQDGVTLIEELRRRNFRTPVMLLTARDAVGDRVRGLDAGADDYLSKPFAFAELLARVRALLRRAPAKEPLRRSVADLTVDFEARRATRGSNALDLTPREFDLLVFLICQAGRIVSREEIITQVWRETHRFTPLDNVIDVHMARLRRKLDDGHAIRLLHTVRGVGHIPREEGADEGVA